MTITSAGMNGSPKDVVVAIASSDTIAEVAGKIIVGLNTDVDVSAKFIATLDDDDATIILTALEYAANDATLAFGFVDTDSTGVTCGASTDDTAGVATVDVTIIGYIN